MEKITTVLAVLAIASTLGVVAILLWAIVLNLITGATAIIGLKLQIVLGVLLGFINVGIALAVFSK